MAVISTSSNHRVWSRFNFQLSFAHPLAYEVAFSEYALSLALELAQRDEYMDITDPIVDIGETINRVAPCANNL